MSQTLADMETRKPAGRPADARRLWHSLGFRALLYQIAVIALVVGTAVFMIGNAQEAMERRGISTGFGFLWEETGFAIGESLISYSPADTYLRAYVVAVLNSLTVSAFGVVGATVLGTLLGLARLSSNWLISKLASLYVEVFRNTPQLVQIIFWYALVTRLPHPRQALQPIDGLFLSNRGIAFAWPVPDPVHWWVVAALAAGWAGACALARWAEARRRRTGREVRVLWPAVALVVGLPVAVWLAGGAPTAMDVPELRGFNFVGGATVSPEFVALFLGLSLYIAAFIAEIVRSGVQSVGRGQLEAARSLGLGQGIIYRKVVLPQALRVIVPPAAAQYVSLTKNSSLGVAIGYPELFNVNNTIITESGHTIEAIGLMMAVYLTISFAIALVMNWYNRVVQIKER